MLMGEEGAVGQWGAGADIAHLSLGHMFETLPWSTAADGARYAAVCSITADGGLEAKDVPHLQLWLICTQTGTKHGELLLFSIKQDSGRVGNDLLRIHYCLSPSECWDWTHDLD